MQPYLLRHGLFYFLLTGVVLTSGCATVGTYIGTDKCARFDQIRKSTSYDTVYSYSQSETRRAERNFVRRPRRAHATVRWYTLQLNRTRTEPCEHLYLIKSLYIQRSSQSLTFEEQREFYTAKGQLIATKRENITEQLSKSGFYTASVPLPIPRNAPAGSYRVVSHLLVTAARGRSQTLATASTEFWIQ